MKKSLFGSLLGMFFLMGGLILIVRKGFLGGAILLVALSLLTFGVSVLTGFFYAGKKVQGRDRHP